MSDKVRVLRILEYVGDREWVEECLKGSVVPLNGQKQLSKKGLIKSAVIDTFPEILSNDDNSINYKVSFDNLLQIAKPEYIEDNLYSFGYHVGNYTGKCISCNKTMNGVDKRCQVCYECAKKRWREVYNK